MNTVVIQGFGCFSGFIAAAFVAYLTLRSSLNASMTCYQVFRKTLVELGKNVYSCSLSLTSSSHCGLTYNTHTHNTRTFMCIRPT